MDYYDKLVNINDIFVTRTYFSKRSKTSFSKIGFLSNVIIVQSL